MNLTNLNVEQAPIPYGRREVPQVNCVTVFPKKWFCLRPLNRRWAFTCLYELYTPIYNQQPLRTCCQPHSRCYMSHIIAFLWPKATSVAYTSGTHLYSLPDHWAQLRAGGRPHVYRIYTMNNGPSSKQPPLVHSGKHPQEASCSSPVKFLSAQNKLLT